MRDLRFEVLLIPERIDDIAGARLCLLTSEDFNIEYYGHYGRTEACNTIF